MDNLSDLLGGTTDLLEIESGSLVSAKDALQNKVVGVLIGPHWFPEPLHETISSFNDFIEDLKAEGHPCAFVYVAADRDEEVVRSLKAQGVSLDERPDEECFDDVLKKLPEGWLAVPFSNSHVRTTLSGILRSGLIDLAFLAENGEIHTKDGFEMLEKWGASGFPYSSDRIQQLEEELNKKKLNQTLESLLVTEDRDYVIRNDGTQVKVADIKGKTVGLYFSAHWCGPCRRFTPVLKELYEELRAKNKEFEIVFISWDKDEEEFNSYHGEMPWLALPFAHKKIKDMLSNWFNVEGIPTFVVLDEQGKTLTLEGVELVTKHGVDVFPFTKERMEELKAEEDARRAAQTLDSLLVTSTRDYVISHDDQQVKIEALKGKTVGLYFSAHWCPPCRAFTPKLASIYNELKEQNAQFEVVFISSDRDVESFKNYYNMMPWLALPYSDRQHKSTLSSYFEVEGIPCLVILGPDGKTVTSEGRNVVVTHGSKGFPFTKERLTALKQELDEEISKLAKEINHPKHVEHPLILSQDAYDGRQYGCDLCDEEGTGWVYHCDVCSFDLHPSCATAHQAPPSSDQKEGWVCEGDVCKKK